MKEYMKRISLKLPSLLLLAMTFVLGSCGSAEIIVEHFDSEITAQKGENAQINWEFTNADSVVIDGIPVVFSPNDSFIFNAEESESYSVTAYGGSDYLTMKSMVLVDNENNSIEISNDNDKILRGPDYSQASYSQPSNYTSDYYSGIVNASNAVEPARFRIMRTVYSDYNESYITQAILLDGYGNYISGYSADDLSIELSSSHKCASPPITTRVEAFTEVFGQAGDNYDIGIAVDVSASSDNPALTVNYVKEFLTRQSSNDKFMISVFNQNFSVFVPLTDPNEAMWALSHTEMPAPDGLSALNKAAFLGVDRLSLGNNKKKAFIIITHNSDNASIIYSANDIARLSAETEIPVYIIGIGEALESYSLKYLAAATGGRFYHIFKEDIFDLHKILGEITYSLKNHYEFELPIQDEFANCSTLKSKIQFKNDLATVYDRSNLILKPTVQSLKYQSITNFEYRDTVISNTYKSQLRSLANVLKDNLSVPVELIGHCSIKEFPGRENELSVRRALAVKRFMRQLGVSGNQINIKGEGASQPIYFLQVNNWQSFYNRRVEVRWLDPSVFPYEITAEVERTEEFAFESVEKWEQMGYKAYYDRYLLETDQIYRIKLWGYASKDDANETAKFLTRKYKRKFYVE